MPAISTSRPTERDDLMALLDDSPTLNSVEIELRTARRPTAIWVLKNLTLVGESHPHHRSSTSATGNAPRNRSSSTPTTTSLTHLPNRKLFTDRLDAEPSRTRAARTSRWR